MTINYNTLTTDGLEEHVEFIDWSLVPSHLITDHIKQTFGLFSKLKARLWLEDLISKMMIKEDQEKYPNESFFFIEDKWYMDLNLKTGTLWCSYDKIWSFLENKNGFNYNETQSFIKNVVEMCFKKEEVTPAYTYSFTGFELEMHFKNTIVTPTSSIVVDGSKVEMHFKNMAVVTPQYGICMEHVGVEVHFKNTEVTPYFSMPKKDELVEKHFKNMTVTPNSTNTPPLPVLNMHFKK